MLLPVEDDVAPNPVDVRLFRAVAVVTEADRVPDALPQFLRAPDRRIVRGVRVGHAARPFEDRAAGVSCGFRAMIAGHREARRSEWPFLDAGERAAVRRNCLVTL